MNIREHSISLVSGLAGVIVASVAQYFINYHFIERPKIVLENKKAALEAQKQALSLAPLVDSSCSSTRLDLWSWRVDCQSTNKGKYPAVISIEKTTVHLSTDPNETLYQEGNGGFNVDYPNDKKTFMGTPDTPGGYLHFNLRFDKNKYPSGMNRNDIIARVRFTYKAPDSAVRFVTDQFPEVRGMLNDFSTNASSVFTALSEK